MYHWRWVDGRTKCIRWQTSAPLPPIQVNLLTWQLLSSILRIFQLSACAVSKQNSFQHVPHPWNLINIYGDPCRCNAYRRLAVWLRQACLHCSEAVCIATTSDQWIEETGYAAYTAYKTRYGRLQEQKESSRVWREIVNMHASMFSAFALEVDAFRLLAALPRQRTVIVLQVATDPYVRRLHTFKDDSIICDGPIDQPNVRTK